MNKKILLFAITILTALSIFACQKKEDGFVRVDGKEIFLENGEQVFDKLVEVGNHKYYIDKNGNKIVNGWAIINNDGNYAYFGSKGQMVKDALKSIDGKLYILDKNGLMKANTLVEYKGAMYFANSDGSLAVNDVKTIVDKKYYFGSDGKLVKTEPIDKTPAAPPVVPVPVPVPVTPTPVPIEPGVAPDTGEELYIADLNRFTESFEGKDERSCKITYLKPIIGGVNQNEVTNFNNGINECMNDLSADLESMITSAEITPKSIVFTKAEITSLTRRVCRITLTAKIKYSFWGSKRIRYRITFDREDGSTTINPV